jgi:hypothetical protein
VLLLRWDSLPPVVDLRFPPSISDALPQSISRDRLVELPRVGSAILAINLVLGVALHAWDRVAGYALFLAAACAQVAIAVGLALMLRDI